MVSHNIEQIPKQQCQLFLVQTTLLRAVVDFESYKFYKYSCKILTYYILEGMGAGRDGGWEGRGVRETCYKILML